MKIKRSAGEHIFEVFNIVFMALIILVMTYPLLYTIFASMSDANRLIAHNGLLIKPLGFSLEAYKMMSKNSNIINGYMNTLFIVTAGTAVNIFLTSLGAYFMSTDGLMFKKPINIMIIVTMYFSGGIIPMYFNVISLGLENSLWAMIFPTAINTFNLIVMSSAFRSIPVSIKESAYLDGAGEMCMLFKMILPLSKATIAVMILYYGVDHWNEWFNAALFLNDRRLYPLQLILREILIQNDTSAMSQGVMMEDQFAISETIKYAVTVAATLPILCVYPFLQKYFEKGVMIGAVKG
ncbi:MAG: carbohydrate ABC transporter permease [Clostridia bacterium]|nr:carbohydrate ABC transporter permease [Clostridia bacterium]